MLRAADALLLDVAIATHAARIDVNVAATPRALSTCGIIVAIIIIVAIL